MNIKYSIIHGNGCIEFSTIESAQEYKSLNGLSDEIETIEYPDDVIPNVTPRQIRQALILSGISIETIENALNNLPEPTKSLANIEWEFSIAFERDRPLVNDVAKLLGMSKEQLDSLWLFAGTL